jgi:YjbE family integral membrane protein
VDVGTFGTISLDWNFLSSLFSIILIDLILAGDNAVVIAMAVRSLSQDKRKKGILFGAGAAVVLRVVATFFVSQLLNISYVKLIGGILILWIAVKLFVEGAPEDDQERRAATIWQAVKVIVIADITMSLDNMLAVGGASHGNVFLLLFGLALSIPFVVFTSNLLSLLMDKYPVIIYVGAAILGKVGGEMIITDPFIMQFLPAALTTPDQAAPVKTLQYGVEVLFAAGVIVAGKLWMRWTLRKEAEEGIMHVMEKTASQLAPQAVLTISREFGSGGREIGRAVARELGYRYVDRDILLEDIRKDGAKWEQWAKDLDEHCPTVWERYDWSFRGFAALIQWHILEYARQGGVVIMGRGGNFVLKGEPSVLRIRVTAPLDIRTERIAGRDGVDRDTARWLCEKTDHERARFLHSIYSGRWDDPAEYDWIISVTSQSVEREAREVIEALRRITVTPEAEQRISLRAAAARVKAGIATDSALFIPIFDVLPEGDGLVMRGITHTPKEHHRIEEAARRLAAGRAIRFELHYRK